MMCAVLPPRPMMSWIEYMSSRSGSAPSDSSSFTILQNVRTDSVSH